MLKKYDTLVGSHQDMAKVTNLMIVVVHDKALPNLNFTQILANSAQVDAVCLFLNAYIGGFTCIYNYLGIYMHANTADTTYQNDIFVEWTKFYIQHLNIFIKQIAMIKIMLGEYLVLVGNITK